MKNRWRLTLLGMAILVLMTCFRAPLLAAETPAVGGKAPDFSLATPTGKVVKLSTALGNQQVILVVLRGYPGYTRVRPQN